MDESQGVSEQPVVTQVAGETQQPPAASPQVQYMLPKATELLRWAWSYYTTHLQLILSITAVPAVIALMAFFAAQALPKPAADLFAFVGAIVGYVASFAIIAAITAEGSTLQSAYRRALALFFATVWVVILSGLATLGGFVLLIVPGIILSIYLTFAVYILYAEDLRGMSALSRSWHYAEGLLGQIFWRSVFIGLVLLGVYLVLGIVVGIVSPGPTLSAAAGAGETPLATLLQTLLQTLIMGPLSSIYVYGMYRSLQESKKLVPVSEAGMQKARRRIKIFSIVGVVAIVAILILGVFIAATFMDASSLQLQAPTSPTSGASAILGVVGELSR